MFKMTTAPQDPLILQLLPIVTQACEILREEYQRYCAGESFDIAHKDDYSPVTQADFRVHEYIASQLSQNFQWPILSEEGNENGRHDWETFWLLDPLDGTKEFLHRRDQFTINLSLIEGNLTTFAILAVPCEQTFYICPKQGLPLKYEITEQRWSCYEHADEQHTIQVGLSHSSQQKGHYADYLDALENLADFKIFKAGSAYKFCMILEDQVDIYPRFHPTCEWDTSAGQCLIERIGGGLIDFQGKPFSYNQRETLLNGGFLAYRNLKMKQLALQALGRMSNKH